MKFWSSLLLCIVSCTVEDLIRSLDGSKKRRGEFIAPKKKLKVDSNITNLALSFPVDVFQNITRDFSFEDFWPQLRDRILILS